ncbi:ATP-binding cassette domain-containing protein [Candidatus Poribacteria bacterium]|nr:ATP-binding cassette domain-containing protein [Candidatus Poribacteria bacterium]
MKTSTRLLKYILPYSVSIAIAVLCTFFIAICEMGYLSILADTIDAINVIDNKGLPTSVEFLKKLPDQYKITISLADTRAALMLVTYVALSILALFLIKGILSFIHKYSMARVGQKLILHLRNDLYNRLLHFPLRFFSERRTGDIMSRGTNDMSMLQNAVNSLADVIKAGATVIVVLVMMIITSWQLTILTALIFPPAIYVINRFGRRIKGASSRIQEKVADISSYLERTIFGIKIIKSFATEDWERQRFTQENKQKYSAAMKRVRLSAYFLPIIEIITALGLVSVFWLGFWQVITGRLSTGWFIAFIGMVGSIYKPVKTLGTFNAAFQQALASADRIFEIMDTHPEPHDIPGAIEIPTIKGDVVFSDVTFAYNGSKSVLENINLEARAGETIALVGPSGAGKSTLVSLLTRFYEIKNGDISIDGQSISGVTLKSLREQVGLVPQETVIFGGTVRENVAYGKFNATEEEVIHAAKSANAHEFIEKLPRGYDTPIGERGAQISGGQRQRLAIARAILKNPRILILDEATSSLDTESESLIQEALENLMSDRTTFVIAHRLSTVVNADKIVVMNNGEIVESGTHSQLMEHNGLYSKLCEAQFRSN